ncbi:hypothetical protein GGR54DRAFT_653092 [Hypoxylon sp. NC1633]|nr:hypothetical protein GGR54DRAFT_653092 [Hypoxylon sp. NC1633]
MVDGTDVASAVVGALSLTVQIAQLTQDHVSRVSSLPSNITLYLAELVSLKSLLSEIQDSLLVQSITPGYAASTHAPLPAELRHIRSELEDLNGKLRDAQLQKVPLMVKKLLWPFGEDETLRWATRLSLCKERLRATTLMIGLRLQLSTLSEIRELKKKTEAVEEANEKQLMLDWISRDDWRRRHAELTSTHHPDTGQWIFDTVELKDWLNNMSPVLWCYGAPGVGKTQLISLIIDHLDKTGSKVSYFYCDYRTSGHKSIATEIAAAILRQLVETEPTIPTALKDIYQGLYSGRKKLKLDDITTLIKHICLTRPDCFVVLDALDECNTQRKQVLQVLRKIADTPARVLVSSRPHIREITRAFDSYSQLEIKTDSSDIRAFVDYMINTGSELPELVPRDLRQEIVQRVTDQSSPMFLISALQCNRLIHASRLSEIKKAVSELPTGLDDLYKESMDRIELEPHERRTIAMRALCWIYHSKRQLSTEELLHALAIEPHEDIPLYEDVVSRKVVLDVCAGLVVINTEHDTFRFVHQSLHEYFARTSDKWFPRARLDITKACLTYLRLLSPERGIVESVSSHPFLRYAAQHWGGHARDEYSEELDSSVLAVFQNEAMVTMVSIILDEEQSGENVALMSSSPNIAIQVSARLGALPILKILLRNGLQPNGADSRGRTALHWAARGGFADVVQCLLQSGAEACPRTESGMTPLQWAAKHGHTRVVEELLSVSDPDETTLDGRTALHWACSRGHLSVASLLLSDDRVDVARQCDKGWTALHWAACSGNRAVAARAVQREISGSGGSFGHHLISHSMNGGESQRHEQVVNLLLESGADPNAQNKDQQTALHWAAASGNARIASILLEHGSDMRTRDIHGFTPWYFAKENAVDDVVIRMLDISGDGDAVVQ